MQLNWEGTSTIAEVEGSVIQVTRDRAVIGPPLRGGPWRVGNGPSNTSNHRRTFSVQAANFTNPERFAIDYVKAGEDGFQFTDDELVNQNHHAYGEDVLAVADGVVVAAKNDLPDHDPRTPRPVPTQETAPGNHIVLDIGHGAYAMYARLKPASLRVAVGKRVKRGEVIGLLGNRGNSPYPHLHSTTRRSLRCRINGLRAAATAISMNCVGPLNLTPSLAGPMPRSRRPGDSHLAQTGIQNALQWKHEDDD